MLSRKGKTDEVDNPDPKDVPEDAGTQPVFKGLDKDVTTGTRETQFNEICSGSRKVFLQKNAEYGDAISRTGVLGAAVEIVGISARIEHIVLGQLDAGKSQRAKLIDIVKDLHNYANIMGIMIVDENWRPGQK